MRALVYEILGALLYVVGNLRFPYDPSLIFVLFNLSREPTVPLRPLPNFCIIQSK